MRLRTAWIACTAAGLLTLPPLVTKPAPGLDPSWQIGLHLCRERGLVVGRDLFFTYGPWGFASVPLALTFPSWLLAVLYRVAGQVALFTLLGLWARRHLSGPRMLLALVPLLLFPPNPEYTWLLALWFGTRLALERPGRRGGACAVVGAAAAAAAFVKFSMGLSALLVTATGACAAWLLGRRRPALTLAAGFASGLPLWGGVALGSLAALGPFLSTSLAISTGYAAALERGGPLWQPIVLLASIGLVALGLVADRRELPAGLALSAGAATGLLLVAFKHGFVRQETHSVLVLGASACLLGWIALEAAGRGGRAGPRMRAGGALLLSAAALWVAPPTSLARRPIELVRNVGATLGAAHDLRNPAHRDRVRAELQRRLPLHPAARALVGEYRVDVLTTEIALAEAWNLEWTPRPILQGYAVTTAGLDARDAAFFAGPSAPERLLVDPRGLDTRHPFLDAPRTWREILARYEPLGRDARWLVLGRREQPRRIVERPLARARVPLSHALRLPRPSAGHLELSVELEPSLWGRLVSIPWKAPEVRLALLSEDPPPPRRVVAATGGSPFPLGRDWPDTAEELWNLFAHPAQAPPDELAFLSRGPWAWRHAVVELHEVEWLEPP